MWCRVMPPFLQPGLWWRSRRASKRSRFPPVYNVQTQPRDPRWAEKPYGPQKTTAWHRPHDSAAGAGDQERVTHQAHKLTLSLHSAAGAGDQERVTHQAHKLHFHYIQLQEPETKRESHTKPTNYTFITFSKSHSQTFRVLQKRKNSSVHQRILKNEMYQFSQNCERF